MPGTLAIVLNWNKRATLERMLESLLASGPRDYDIVVVDNGSTDGSVEMLREKYPWVQQVLNTQNLGGTGGFNRGMQYGLSHPNKYDFLWLLDNDVIVHPGAFEGLMAPMHADPRVGMVGSTVLLLDDPGYAQEAGVRISPSTGAFNRMGGGPVAEVRRPQLFPVDYVAACSLLARVEAVREVGIWDPHYFVNFDDIEWGLRFNRAGWKVLGTTESRVQHESFIDRRAQNAVFSGYICNRNAMYGFWRWSRYPYKIRLFYRMFRGMLLAAAAFEEEGIHAEARAVRLAIRDFENGRMGPPPPELNAPLDVAEPAHNRLPEGYDRPIRRIALLARDNPESCRRMHERLREHFPEAEVETVVLRGNPELDRVELPNRRFISIVNFPLRVWHTIVFPMRYDAVASPLSLYRHFFERPVPIHIRYNQDFTWWVARRSGMKATARHLMQRVGIMFTSIWKMMQTCARKPWPVDYHEFNEPGKHPSFEARDGAHWRERGGYGAPQNPGRRAVKVLVHGLLLPFAVLTMIAVLVTMPALHLLDRLRRRT